MSAPTSKSPYLSFASDRRFGIELELLAFDGKNRPEQGQQPDGIEKVAVIVAANATEPVEIKGYEHTDGNNSWVIKPDSSCGMEVCTPILKGWHGLRKVCEVVHAFANHPQIKIDQRCSVHVHVEVADLSQEELASVIAHWVKVEPVFLDSVPPNRKRNRYCQFIGLQPIFQCETKSKADDIIKKVGNVKYYSLNTNQMLRNGRRTIEFRIIEGDGVKDPYLIKNWVRLIVHFIEMARKRPIPGPWVEGDPWSSVLWLDPEDVFKLLGFNDNPKEYELSPGLAQTRNWFLARLQKYISRDENGIRCKAAKELDRMLDRFAANGTIICPEKHLTPSDLKEALYNEETKS